MNITLSPELETMIREKVEAGEYHDASEVVSEALRLMEENESKSRREKLNAALAIGIAELDAGLGVEMSDEDWERLMDEGEELAASGAPIDPDVLPNG